MFATFVTVALFALPAFATTFSIETPKSLVATFKWSGGKAPYNLVIVESSNPCGDIIHQFADTNATSLNWSSVIIPTEYVGKDLSLSLEDADENEAWSTSIPYSTNGDNTCLGGGPASHSYPSSSEAPGTSTIPANAEATPLVTATATADGGGATAAGAVGNAGALTGINGAFSNQMSGSALIAGAVVGIFALSL
ncbi:hypothetical protein HWV62_3442 [Athelia sp. TMB]|nr:hypothetical protein HWV62_44870 [Athelia sp. TMB]KAF7973507.1 hypothetical protein HWV62_15018 [Athelia sp. TMB]KAF7977487.1 hypothetical protein HWV62_3442 [Athelia sp. TMB]